MDFNELKDQWLGHYSSAPEQLSKMGNVKSLISAFNANVDAVIKISGNDINRIINDNNLDISKITSGSEKSITKNEDVIRGILECFEEGKAEEWLIEDKDVFLWLNKALGYDKLQMGGQGGIVANVMAVCGVKSVYVHCASSPKEQSQLFLDTPNLLSVDENGKIAQASKIDRKNDLALIHWIIEFDKGDELELNGKKYVCPKSNRFIATYDPLNFILHIDEKFSNAVSENGDPEYIILSGYQMLHENLSGGGKGIERIDYSKDVIKKWRKNGNNNMLHLEVASTQDLTIRKYLVDALAKESDSVGLNERELIDILEVIGEDELAEKCNADINSVNLFDALIKVFEYTGCPRIQLHMFGLYLTVQKKGFTVTPEQNRNGMQLAAIIAAAKAGTGAIDTKDVLMWANGKKVSDEGLTELTNLETHLNKIYGETNISKTGIFSNGDLDIIAVPTIIIDKPITLVGMGDTISSVSLVGAQ